jgi:hypothetical protein
LISFWERLWEQSLPLFSLGRHEDHSLECEADLSFD